MYGLWPEKHIFETTKQKFGTVPKDMMDEELGRVDKRFFKEKYKQKEFMEEMLKAKHMMGKFKRWSQCEYDAISYS